MSCDEIRLELVGVAAGETAGAEGGRVHEHLRACAECRRELTGLEQGIGVIRVAPLRQEVPQHLEEEVFRFVELEPVADLVRTAALEHDPPVGLERDSLARSGAFQRPLRLGGWQRVAPVVAPGLAASLIVLGFLGASWRSEATDARRQLSRVGARFGPWGDSVKRFELTPMASSATSWPSVEAQLVRLPNDHFGVVLHLEDYPATPDGHVCQLWLVGDNGERAPLGAFTVPEGLETRTVPLEVPVDPRDFPRIEVTLEPVDDNEAMDGPKIMEANLDF